MAKALREKKESGMKRGKEEDIEALIASLQTLTTNRVKTIRAKKLSKDEQRYGLLDSGATRAVREIKKEEVCQSLIPWQ